MKETTKLALPTQSTLPTISTLSTKCSRKLSQNRGVETKNAIITAGIDLFAEFGFHKVNTKEIAKAAGVSIGSFYGYYEDKKHLFLELVEIYKEDLLNAALCQNNKESEPSINCEVAPLSYTYGEVINYFINRKLSVAEKYPLAFHHELNHMRYRDSDVEAVFLRYYQKEIDNFEISLSQHSDALRVTDYRMAAEIIYQISDDMMGAYLSPKSQEIKDALINEYKLMLHLYLFL